MENNASDGISGAFFLSGQSFSLTSGAEDSIIAIITLEDVKMEKYAQNPFLWEKNLDTNQWEPTTYEETLKIAKRVAAAVKDVFPCRKVGMAVLGLEVNHAHIHLAPLQSEIDMDFGKKKLQLPAEEMQEIADRILKAFNAANPE